MKRKKENIADSPRREPLKEDFFVLLLLLLFQLFLIFISNSKLSGEDDLFWYLSAGRYIVQYGSIPSADVFGFTTAGSPWIPFEWGWDIINYSLFSIGSYFALSILSTLLILLIFYLLYLNMQKLKVNVLIAFPLLIILTLGICQRLTVKPHLVTYLSLTLLLTIIIRYRYLNRNVYKPLYFIPLIFLFWVNMHMGVLSGLFMLGIYFGCEIISTFFPAIFISENLRVLNRKELFRLGMVLIVSALITLVNPHGFKTFEYAFHIVSMKQLEVIYEWQSPFSAIYLSSASNYFFYFFILCIIPVIYFSIKNRDLFPALLSTGYFLYSLTAARLTIDFMIVSVIFAAVSINYLLNRSGNSRLLLFLNPGKLPRLILAALILLLILLTPSNQIYKTLSYSRSFGTGIENGNFPVKMYDFIASSGLDSIGSRPFNTYETGGYFIWRFPQSRNFIGSRGINDEVWNDYTSIINISGDFERKIDSIGFDYLTWMVPFINYAQNPALLDQGILSYLFNKPDKWKLVYWDDISFVFVRNELKFNDYNLQNEYIYLNPYTFYADFSKLESAVSEDKLRFSEEMERKLKEDPNGNFTKLLYKFFGSKIR